MNIRTSIPDAEVKKVGRKCKEKKWIREILVEGEYMFAYIERFWLRPSIRRWDWMVCLAEYGKFQSIYLSKLEGMLHILDNPLYDRAIFYKNILVSRMTELGRKVVEHNPRRVWDDFLVQYQTYPTLSYTKPY